MLQNIREHAQGWIAWIIAGVLCLAFALWGIENYLGGGNQNKPVATVNGEDITTRQWDVAYQKLQRIQALQTQANLDDATLAKLKNEALQELIQQSILTQAANKNGYVISNQQLSALVMGMPDFQINGKFAPSLFQQIIQQVFPSEQAFFSDLRDKTLILQMQAAIKGTAFTLPNEVDHFLMLQNEKRHIRYLNVLMTDFLKTAKVDESDIETYYDAHKSEFMTQEQISLQYITLSADEAASKVSVSEEEVKQYYEQNKQANTQPYEIARDQIEKDLRQQKVAQLLADQSEQLSNLVYTNPDTLKTAADTLGLKIETTPLFGRKGDSSIPLLNNPKVLAVAFSDNVFGQRNNSDVIAIDDKHAVVIRILDLKPSVLRPLNEVRADIEGTLKSKAAAKEAKAVGEKIVASIKAGTPLASLVEQYQLTLHEVPDLSRKTLDQPAEVVQLAFSLPAPQKDKISAGVTTSKPGDARVVIVDSIILPDLKAFTEADRDNIKNEIAQQWGDLEYYLFTQHYTSRAKVEIQ